MYRLLISYSVTQTSDQCLPQVASQHSTDTACPGNRPSLAAEEHVSVQFRSSLKAGVCWYLGHVY